MQITERENWLLNFYRNSELHGALLMGKLARNFDDPALLVNLTKHCATEAHHADLLSEAIARLGGRFDPELPPMQRYYSAEGGVPAELLDLLVLSDVLEKRVLVSYRQHIDRAGTHPSVREALAQILREEEEHGGEDCWMEQLLEEMPGEQVAAAQAKWRSIDQRVAAQITNYLENKFPEEVTAT